MEEKLISDKKIMEMIHERLDYLRVKTDFFETLFKGIAGYAVIAADFDGNIIAYNEGARLIYGYEPEDVVGRKNFDEFFTKDFVETGGFGKMVDSLMDKGGYSYEVEKVKKNGDRFPAKIILMLTKDDEGKIIGFIEVADDLTERKKWENEIKKLNEALEQKVIERTAQLEESMEHFKALTETANDAIICLKAPDKIYFWNKKAEEIFGYAAGDVIGKELHKLIIPENLREKSWEGLKGFFETGDGNIINKTVELTALRKDGTEFPVELSVSAMNIKGKWHATGIIRDITERKRVENKLKEEFDIITRMNKLMVDRELELGKRKEIIKKLDARISEMQKEKEELKARVKELEK